MNIIFKSETSGLEDPLVSLRRVFVGFFKPTEGENIYKLLVSLIGVANFFVSFRQDYITNEMWITHEREIK